MSVFNLQALRSKKSRLVIVGLTMSLVFFTSCSSSNNTNIDYSGISETTVQIYNYLKNEWLYAGSYEDFEKTFNYYMIKGMLDNDNDPYTFYTSTYEQQGLNNNGTGIYGFTSTPYAAKAEDGKTYGGRLIVSLYNGTLKAAGVKKGDVMIAAKHPSEADFTYFDALSPNETGAFMQPTDADKKEAVTFKLIRDGKFVEATAGLGDYYQDPAELISDSGNSSSTHTVAIKIATFVGTNQYGWPATIVKNLLNSSVTTYGKIDRLVLDCRSNGGGYTDQAGQMARLFLTKGNIIFSEGDSSGKIVKTYYQESDPAFGTDKVDDIRIILNGGSASATELFAKAISENGRGKIYGSTSYGKGIEQALITLKHGGTLRLTFRKVYGPKGTTFDGVGKKGITPDVATNDYDVYSNYLVGNPYEENSYRLTYAEEQKVLNGLKLVYGLDDTYKYATAVLKLQENEGLEQTGLYDTYTLYRYYRLCVGKYYAGEDNELQKVVQGV
jgi:C-terminal processing protease CtpA/Prc